MTPRRRYAAALPSGGSLRARWRATPNEAIETHRVCCSNTPDV
jgi:hypothetical protein